MKVINGSVVTTALTKQYLSTTLRHTREICTDHIRQLQATAENEHLSWVLYIEFYEQMVHHFFRIQSRMELMLAWS